MIQTISAIPASNKTARFHRIRSKGSLLCVATLMSATILPLLGCGETAKAPNRPKTVPVTGVVTLKGNPVADVRVTFAPNTNTGNGAIGVTNEKGEFKLMTFVPGDGAIPGPYRVALTKSVTEGSVLTEDSSASSTAVTKHLINVRYSNPNSSGLSANVEDGKENNFTFPIED